MKTSLGELVKVKVSVQDSVSGHRCDCSDRCAGVWLEPRFDVLGFRARSDDAEPDRLVPDELQFDDGSDHGISHREAMLGAALLDDAKAGGGANLIAREQAIQELQAECGARGGNAVVGVDLDYEVIGDTGSMLMVSASGTAVKI